MAAMNGDLLNVYGRRRTRGKGTNKSWLFWDNVNKVKSGDFILHLRGKGKEAEIVGYSIAKTDGYRTEECPPIAGEWA